eukprot:SAG11_NODE_1931_length_4044_cov_1.223517_2_plen_231_part_00
MPSQQEQQPDAAWCSWGFNQAERWREDGFALAYRIGRGAEALRTARKAVVGVAVRFEQGAIFEYAPAEDTDADGFGSGVRPPRATACLPPLYATVPLLYRRCPSMRLPAPLRVPLPSPLLAACCPPFLATSRRASGGVGGGWGGRSAEVAGRSRRRRRSRSGSCGGGRSRLAATPPLRRRSASGRSRRPASRHRCWRAAGRAATDRRSAVAGCVVRGWWCAPRSEASHIT